MDPISDLAEQLAQSIHRSVTVYDADLRLLGYSSHYDDADPLRLNSLVSRRLEGPIRDVAFESRFRSWREPFRRPAMHAHGHEHDRISFPIRSRYEFLGFACVIDDEGLSDEEMQECISVAGKMERLLETEAEFNQEVESLLLTLLSDATESRDAAARDLRDLKFFTSSTEVTALVMLIDDPSSHVAFEYAAAMRRALKLVTSAYLGRSATSAVTENSAFLLIGGRGNTPREEYMKIAGHISAEVALIEPELADRTFFGVGTPVELVQAFMSYDHATVAAQIARNKRRSAVIWQDHSLEALLAASLKPRIAASFIPPLIRDLVDSQSTEALVTVARFLDEAGNVARVSESMNLHRTTVYYRLRQFEKTTGLSLESGKDRFLLQLWFAMRDRVESDGVRR